MIKKHKTMFLLLLIWWITAASLTAAAANNPKIPPAGFYCPTGATCHIQSGLNSQFWAICPGRWVITTSGDQAVLLVCELSGEDSPFNEE